MSDEKSRVPETLQTLGEGIAALAKSMDARFTILEKSMATQFAEVKAQLGTRIEALDTKITLVYDTVIAQTDKNKANDTAHERFEKRLDNHDTRILALEHPKPPTSEPAPPALP